MQLIFRRINPNLMMSLITRLFFFDVLAWVLFRSATHSVVTLLAFVFGGTILSFGIHIRITRPEPVAVGQNARTGTYQIPLSDQSSALM